MDLNLPQAGPKQRDSLALSSRFILTGSLSVAAILLIFAVSWLVPFQVEGDVAYAARAAQQHSLGQSGFNRLRLVSPDDLSQDVETWLFFWPPAISAMFGMLLRAKFSLGAAGRLLMLAAALSGVIGWACIAALLLKRRAALVLAATASVLYIFENAMFLSFNVGDGIVFAIIPWLFALSLRTVNQWKVSGKVSVWPFAAICFCLGSLYWVKYSAMFPALAIWCFLALAALRCRRSSSTVLVLVSGTAMLLAPVSALWFMNRIFGGNLLDDRFASAIHHPDVRFFLYKLLGSAILDPAPGIIRIFGDGDGLLNVLPYLPGVVLVVLTIAGCLAGTAFEAGLLALLLIAIPAPGIMYLGWRSGYFAVGDAIRYCQPYWILLDLLLIGLAMGDIPLVQRWGRALRFSIVGLTAYACLFAAFVPYVALKNSIRPARSTASRKSQLYIPTLSGTNSSGIASTINSIIRSNDVVVPATYWLGQETWLELDGRLLPLTNFWEPLGATHGRNGADYFSSTPFISSRPLRLVLVAADPYSRSDFSSSIQRIKSRFPQAHDWKMALVFPPDRVQVWIADLTV